MQDAETLGQRIARIRKLRGFTQVELAARMEIIQSLVSDYERDRLRPHPEMLARFATVLDVSADELLGLERPKQRRAEGALPNRRLLRRLEQISKLPRRDQDALVRTIDAFLKATAS